MISNSVQLNLQLNQNIENLMEITSTELLYIETNGGEDQKQGVRPDPSHVHVSSNSGGSLRAIPNHFSTGGSPVKINKALFLLNIFNRIRRHNDIMQIFPSLTFVWQLECLPPMLVFYLFLISH